MRSGLGCCACLGGFRSALSSLKTARAAGLLEDCETAGDGAPSVQQTDPGEGPQRSPAPPPPCPDPLFGGGDAADVSLRQRRKSVRRAARKERKGQKKLQKQNDSLETALAALAAALAELLGTGAPASGDAAALRQSLCRSFGVAGLYGELPRAQGPARDRGMEALGAALVRPAKYNEKFLPQEYSLLHKVWVLLGGDCNQAGVLDIGAGNANCAVLAATMLGITVICVERDSPREELRADAQLPEQLRQRVIRFESDIDDFDASTLHKVAADHGLRRLVLLAKHPCGIGADRSIACAARLLDAGSRPEGSPEVAGAVLATCCTNKLSQDDFRESRVPEYCGYYAGDLPGGRGAGAEEALERAVEVMSRSSAWRTTAGSLGNNVLAGQVEWAELFEDCLQAPRLQRLSRVFGAAAQVRFAPRSCTLQDRCLVAAVAPLPASLWAYGDQAVDEAFVARLQDSGRELLATSGPIDCRPKGLKSERYGFDYTGAAED